jgi:hypothetical protein
MPKKNSTLRITLCVIGCLFLFMLAIRICSQEDDWLCQDGQWVKHGNPTMEMPNMECRWRLFLPLTKDHHSIYYVLNETDHLKKPIPPCPYFSPRGDLIWPFSKKMNPPLWGGFYLYRSSSIEGATPSAPTNPLPKRSPLMGNRPGKEVAL